MLLTHTFALCVLCVACFYLSALAHSWFNNSAHSLTHSLGSCINFWWHALIFGLPITVSCNWLTWLKVVCIVWWVVPRCTCAQAECFTSCYLHAFTPWTSIASQSFKDIQVHSSGMFTFKVVLQYLVKNRVIISLMEMAVFAKTIAF